MNSIKILYENCRITGKVRATAFNQSTGRRFHISLYTNLEKAKRLAPIWLSKRIKNPSSQFLDFLNF